MKHEYIFPPQTTQVAGKFDPAHPRTVSYCRFTKDGMVYEEAYLDSEMSGVPLSYLIEHLQMQGQAWNNPHVIRRDCGDTYPQYEYYIWHLRPATDLEAEIYAAHIAKEKEKAKKAAAKIKNNNEAQEKKLYEKLKKKFESSK